MQRRSQHNADLALLQHVRCTVTHPSLRTSIRQILKTESSLVIMGRLLGIAYIKFYVIRTVQWQEVVCFGWLFYSLCFHGLFFLIRHCEERSNLLAALSRATRLLRRHTASPYAASRNDVAG